jgi:thymidylate kinase
MGVDKLLIILLGPQASGKTTQAILLKKKLKELGCRVIVTEGIHYTLLLKAWHKLIILLTGRKIRYKFRSEDLIEEFIEPLLLAHIFPLDFIINLTSAIISSLKIFLLSIFYPTIIEHEGFIYNQLAYLCFIYRRLFDTKFLMKKYQVLLKLLPKDKLIILLDVTNLKPTDLRVRYSKRKSLSEPWYYIRYQAAVYKALASSEYRCAVFDANMDKYRLFDAIFAFVSQNLR